MKLFYHTQQKRHAFRAFLRIQLTMTSDSDKLYYFIISFFVHCSYVACYIDASTRRPFARKWMIP